MFPVVILAGGLATRLRPLTEQTPKSLIEINGEPFIAHQLRAVREQGVSEAVLCLGFLGERVQEFVLNGEEFGLQVKYAFDGSTLECSSLSGTQLRCRSRLRLWLRIIILCWTAVGRSSSSRRR